MRISNKARLFAASQAGLAFALAGLAMEYRGWGVAVAAAGVPVLAVLLMVYLGSVRCPRCGNNACGPAPGEVDMNPYYRLLYHGRCEYCREKI